MSLANILHSLSGKSSHQSQIEQAYIDAIYETNILLCAVSSFPQLLNIAHLSSYETMMRAIEVKKLKRFANSVTQEFLYGDKAMSHISMNPAGGVLSLSIVTHYNYLCFDYIEKLKAAKKAMEEIRYIEGLQKQQTSDKGHIYTDPFNTSEPAFAPKTIVNIFNHKHDMSIYNTLKAQMETILTSDNQKRCDDMNDMVETRIITEEDCKREGTPPVLIGQKGIYATKDIKKYTVVGFYTGMYIPNEEALKKIIEEHGSEQCGLYMFSFPNMQYPLVSAYQHGNKICLVNASTSYEKSLQEIAKDYHNLNNIAVVYAKSGENPDKDYLANEEAYDLVAYVTTREVKKGEQLLVDYGINYWKSRINTAIDATQEEISKAIADYKAEIERTSKAS